MHYVFRKKLPKLEDSNKNLVYAMGGMGEDNEQGKKKMIAEEGSRTQMHWK